MNACHHPTLHGVVCHSLAQGDFRRYPCPQSTTGESMKRLNLRTNLTETAHRCRKNNGIGATRLATETQGQRRKKRPGRARHLHRHKVGSRTATIAVTVVDDISPAVTWRASSGDPLRNNAWYFLMTSPNRSAPRVRDCRKSKITCIQEATACVSPFRPHFTLEQGSNFSYFCRRVAHRFRLDLRSGNIIFALPG